LIVAQTSRSALAKQGWSPALRTSHEQRVCEHRALAPAELERLAGVYELVDGAQFRISIENGGLTAR
jgi:hypothetical protein